jgi:1-acyl-sn-glycerol-3-phosphate acyltransferase
LPYQILKIFARIALYFYCRNIVINKKDALQFEGPLLLAANHPNSFLDAIILCTLFNKPIYSLARGDTFKNKLAAKILYRLKLLPVYRVSEGVENLEENYKTFDACKKIFKKNGIVLIFSEGRCVNEWRLRPLKKGTARLAISSWNDGINLKVLPVAINYSSFKRFGKNIKLFFGEAIVQQTITNEKSDGQVIKVFNENLQNQLQPYVFDCPVNDTKKLHDYFYVNQSFIKKILLFVPATIGYVAHAPLYYFTKALNKALVKEDAHFDAVMIGLGLFVYPIFVFLITIITFLITNYRCSWLMLVVLPFCAWSYMQLKKQLD